MVSNLTRVNAGLKEKGVENDLMLQRVAQEIRMMHVEVDRRKAEQEALDAQNRQLREELEALKILRVQYDQLNGVLSRESA